ncbi:MAG: protein-L-isoaspartate(D-aspartate) O-methyltransferase [Deltaproteobacteria bacterium]|nr:protein-L-isoaspartate(D-aspartate) O-methyltransferase [Deltaproteobacteria bacterium]MBW1914070.1 protein-L-isoaspartate(D-aspartate) O-methyltransferase [Deltaproteobacteria bacterium]
MVHDYRLARQRMLRNNLIPRGINDPEVLKAMGKIHRHLFVEEALEGEAYNDHPLPIGHKQTISQPYIVALMTQALRLSGKDRVLEIGTGSGYQTAILAELADRVYTVERIRPLMEQARTLLNTMGYTNILFRAFDGTIGWKEHAPYDGIIITAGSPDIPKPLLEQLDEGGRMIVPVGDRSTQTLFRVTRQGNGYSKEDLGGCRFVDLIGAHGWKK